jgi:hypothetical protein
MWQKRGVLYRILRIGTQSFNSALKMNLNQLWFYVKQTRFVRIILPVF